ncbi:ParB/RepB/Spo0J family partition protein [Nonomuraea sp. NPDC059023]|uniref:ParB/RepB/Spo0J family partition protein n=1 Tax=unclassified Nonomuraea TaxID=2593643 RepID=UPI003684D297
MPAAVPADPDTITEPDEPGFADPHLDPEVSVPDDYRLAKIPLKYLGHSPKNVRRDYQVSAAFCASLKAELQVVITVIPIPDHYQRGEGEQEHRWWVVKGNRRLAGARAVDPPLPHLLCLIDLTKSADDPAHYIDQVVENDEEFRRGLDVFERADALFAAYGSGATKAEIRRRTGRSRDEIAAALKTGRLSAETRAFAQRMDYAWTLDELALLAEFEGDEAALTRIKNVAGQWGRYVRYAVELVRRERADKLAHEAALAELKAAGVTVTKDEPRLAIELKRLARLVDGFDPAGHESCPGHGAYFNSWDPATPILYCGRPHLHGHQPPTHASAPSAKQQDEVPRKVVIEGNRAWPAAATVRQEWLAAFLARKSAPKPLARWITKILHEICRPRSATGSPAPASAACTPSWAAPPTCRRRWPPPGRAG